MLKRRMIGLLEKLLIQRDEIHNEYGTLLRYTQDYQKRLYIIRKVLVQEKEMFEGRKVSGRIVSIDRHYVRPIVRGKETEILWIFFGIHTANALLMIEKIRNKTAKAA